MFREGLSQYCNKQLHIDYIHQNGKNNKYGPSKQIIMWVLSFRTANNQHNIVKQVLQEDWEAINLAVFASIDCLQLHLILHFDAIKEGEQQYLGNYDAQKWNDVENWVLDQLDTNHELVVNDAEGSDPFVVVAEQAD